MRPAPLGSDCPGVDINRNFPLGYGLGADSNPCSEVSFITITNYYNINIKKFYRPSAIFAPPPLACYSLLSLIHVPYVAHCSSIQSYKYNTVSLCIVNSVLLSEVLI